MTSRRERSHSDPGTAVEEASRLMLRFAERTGLIPERLPQRYLWTDGFAVCNFLDLARTTGEQRYLDLALQLVDQVHHVLGRHRPDDSRTGWISGASDQEGEAHPTRGGLRIGKPLPERRLDDAPDVRVEWERDGQYFHYLTKWMHALDQVARATRQPRFNIWARELAEVAHRAFVGAADGEARQRMVWKMSIDLCHPLVPSMGQHDPLDGFITCTQLQATASRLSGAQGGPILRAAAADFAAMTGGPDWLTLDPLGLGGLMTDACRVAQLMQQGDLAERELLDTLMSVALAGLQGLVRQRDLQEPTSRRLPFRELGLAIGLHAIEIIERDLGQSSRGAASNVRVNATLATLGAYHPLALEIEALWLDPASQAGRTWSNHRDINEVMLATSLRPEGYLIIPATALGEGELRSPEPTSGGAGP